jgi:hypothetical protein
MSEKPEKIDWKKRLEAMQKGRTSNPPQLVITSPQPLVIEKLFTPQEAVIKQSEPEPEAVQEATPDVHEVKPIEVCKEPPIPVPDPQAGRVDRLEQQLRSLKVMALVAAFLATIALLGIAFMVKRGPGQVAALSGPTLTINDSQGRCRAWIGQRDGQVRLELRDQAGQPRLALGLGTAGEPRLTFYDKDQHILGEIVSLPDGQPGIKLLNPVSEPVAAVTAPSPSAPDATPPVKPEPQTLAPLSTPAPQPTVVPPEAPQTGHKSAVPAGDPGED